MLVDASVQPLTAAFLWAVAGLLVSASAAAQSALWDEAPGHASRSDIACTYAPSHSDTVGRAAHVMGGMGALDAAVAGMLALKPPGRGLLLFSGPAYRVPPQLAAATARPVLLDVGLRVNAVSYYFDVLCVPHDSAKDYQKLLDAALESQRRLGRGGELPAASFVDPHARAQPQRTVQRLSVLQRPPMGDVYSRAFMVPGKSFSGSAAGP